MISLDTNLLVYSHRSATDQHQAAQKAIEEAASASSGWGFALPCLAEFWTIVTHPAASGGPSPSVVAADYLKTLVDAGAQIWLPTQGFANRLFSKAVQLRLQGPRIFDLQIALISQENGAREIWTHDHGFIKVSGLAIRDPLE